MKKKPAVKTVVKTEKAEEVKKPVFKKPVEPVKETVSTSLGQKGSVVSAPKPAGANASDAEVSNVVHQAYGYKGKTIIVLNNESDFEIVQRTIKGLKNPMISIKVNTRQPSRAIWRSM